MNRVLLFGMALFTALGTTAQPVPRKVVAEHFTNTYCSVCASRNPGLYQNLAAFPQVLHISYYPSAPYPACPVNQYNKAPQDARTKYYGVYGSTPRLLVQGKIISSSFTDPAIFQSELGAVSPFELRATIQKTANNTGSAHIALIRRDTGSVDSLYVYGVLAQDSIAFAANNGEQKLYDVFRAQIGDTGRRKIAVPLAIGDSTLLDVPFTIGTGWPDAHIYATILVQHADNSIEQAVRSGALKLINPTGILTKPESPAVTLYPNPAFSQLNIKGLQANDYTIRICDFEGRIMSSNIVNSQMSSIDIGYLATGVYVLELTSQEGAQHLLFVKK